MAIANEDLFAATAKNLTPEEASAKFLQAIADGANIHATNEYFQPFIHTAGSSPALMKLALAHGADVNTTNKALRTPLMVAVANGNAEMVNLLIDAGADLSLKDIDGKSAIDYAFDAKANNSSAFMLEALARNLPPGGFDSFSDPDSPATHRAITNGDHAALNVLLNHGADPNLKAGRFGTPLLNVACYLNDEDAIKMLLDHGCDPLVTDGFSKAAADNAVTNTALHLLSTKTELSASQLKLMNRMDDVAARFGLRSVGVMDLGGTTQTKLQSIRLLDEKLAEASVKLGIEDKSLGLNGDLSFIVKTEDLAPGELGAYMYNDKVINVNGIAKRGATSTIIHEWTHAVDYKLNAVITNEVKPNTYASRTALADENNAELDDLFGTTTKPHHPLKAQADQAMNEIFSVMGDVGTGSFFKEEAKMLLNEVAPLWVATASDANIEALAEQVEQHLVSIARDKSTMTLFALKEDKTQALQNDITRATGQVPGNLKDVIIDMSNSSQWEDHIDARLNPVNKMSQFMRGSISLDHGMKGEGYWSSSVEMFARFSQMRHDSVGGKMLDMVKTVKLMLSGGESLTSADLDRSIDAVKSSNLLIDKTQARRFDQAFGNILDIVGVQRLSEHRLGIGKQVESVLVNATRAASAVAEKVGDFKLNVAVLGKYNEDGKKRTLRA